MSNHLVWFAINHLGTKIAKIVHENSKPIICLICNNSFGQRSSLKTQTVHDFYMTANSNVSAIECYQIWQNFKSLWEFFEVFLNLRTFCTYAKFHCGQLTKLKPSSCHLVTLVPLNLVPKGNFLICLTIW